VSATASARECAALAAWVFDSTVSRAAEARSFRESAMYCFAAAAVEKVDPELDEDELLDEDDELDVDVLAGAFISAAVLRAPRVLGADICAES
jgi:hypothetical protein